MTAHHSTLSNPILSCGISTSEIGKHLNEDPNSELRNLLLNNFSSLPPVGNMRAPLTPSLQKFGHLTLRSSQSTSEAVLSGDALDTVSGVDVLDEGDLVACRRTLPRDDG
jgi:hypothetical protein